MVHLRGTAAGALSPLLDSVVQEIDIRTGLVVWEWHALGHIPLGDSYATPANSADFDAYHLNSIEPLSGDRLLLSARDTSAVYEIDRVTGRILWTLGGKASSFRLGPGARFYFQHDAQLLGRNGSHCSTTKPGHQCEAPSSRGLVLALDMRRRTATSSVSTAGPGTTRSPTARAACRQLPNGTAFVGFGSSRTSRSSRRPWEAAVRRRPAGRRRQLSGIPVSVERNPDDAAGAPSNRRIGADTRLALRELERRHGRSALAGPRRR